jgi:hypothetical protein
MARKTSRKAHHAQWIPWDDAWKQGQRVNGSLDLVAAQLTERLESGEIPSIDRVITGHGIVETIELSPDFWKQVHIRVENILGSSVAWWPKKGSTLRGEIGQKSDHTVFLGRKAIDAMWPIEATLPKAEIAAPNEIKPDRRKPGPPPKHDWPNQLMPELIRIIHERGIPKTDAALAKKLADFCITHWDWQPDQAHLLRWIRHALHLVRRNSP